MPQSKVRHAFGGVSLSVHYLLSAFGTAISQCLVISYEIRFSDFSRQRRNLTNSRFFLEYF